MKKTLVALAFTLAVPSLASAERPFADPFGEISQGLPISDDTTAGRATPGAKEGEERPAPPAASCDCGGASTERAAERSS